jgi:hypothetical protein
MYANKKKVIWVPRLTPVIPATPEVAIRRTGGLWLEASTGKMFERPHLNQQQAGCGGTCLSSQLCEKSWDKKKSETQPEKKLQQKGCGTVQA